jgi:hypothetical protein
MNRAPQLAIIVSAGALLFIASQWPRYIVPACIVMFGVIWLAVSLISPTAQAKKRTLPRRLAGFVIAAALLLWALFSLLRH